VFDGKLFKVYRIEKNLPNGFRAKLEVVKHPGAVLIVPLLAPDTVIMICQYRPVINTYLWELPAGTLNPGESLLACARRELTEEIGYKAGTFKNIGYIYPAPGYATEKIAIYEACKLKKVAFRLQADEIIEAKAVSKKNIARLLKSGKIIDAKTICALTFSRLASS